jgi:CheY-like chemotaxis protein/anti-sigma regulatory factor (Ser/Thr protein kinase)
MTSHASGLDLRPARVATIVVVDLVKHSQRPSSEIDAIQGIMHAVFGEALARSPRESLQYTYTGDGYVCAFLGESSVLAFDFLNGGIPALQERLQPYDQAIRVGVAFGVVYLRKNELTGRAEHFDLPGVEAARLEACAQPGQILCTESFKALFAPRHPSMFSPEPLRLRAKDREILAWEVRPLRASEIKELLAAYVFRETTGEEADGAHRILVVDDDDETARLLQRCFELVMKCEVVSTTVPREALALHHDGGFSAVVTDEMMPGMLGHELTEAMLADDPSQLVVMITGYADEQVAKRFFGKGGFYFLTKPLDIVNQLRHVASLVRWARARGFVPSRLGIICDDLGGFLWKLQQVGDELHRIRRQIGDSADIARGLLRHKAKQVVRECLEAMRPGADVESALDGALSGLKCVDRLSRPLGRMAVDTLAAYLDGFIQDLRVLHPQVALTVSYSGLDAQTQTAFGSSIVLIVSELVDNAIEAIGRDGVVDASVAVLARAGVLQVVVRDNGPGVAAVVADRMFDERVSSRGAGRGLGLFLVREAVRLLNGSVEYRYQDGSVFRAVVPLA